MLTIADCLEKAKSLADITDSARLDAEVLLAHVLGKDRTYLYTWSDKRLNTEQVQQFETLLARRQQGEPVAYLTGAREFWSLKLKVNASTLIPRPDTELLVEQALLLLPATSQRVVDLGTGTGAIALALASERPQWQLLALDKSADAVTLARENCMHCGLNNVKVMQSDWFAAVEPQQFDLVVSNPPYIDPVDPHLEEGDVRFEPLSALISDEAGLADIRTIARQSKTYLKAGGWLLLEHGFEQGAAVRALLCAEEYREVRTCRDLAGLERVTLGKR